MGVAERFNEKKKKTTGVYNGVEYRHRAKSAEKIGQELSTRVNTWLENNNNFVFNYQQRYRDGNDKYRADSSDWLSTVSTQKSNFETEAQNIKALLTDYRDYFDPEWVSEVEKTLDGGIGIQGQILSDSEKDSQFWSKWDNEEAYNRDKFIWDVSKMTSAEVEKYLNGDNPIAYSTDEGDVTWERIYKDKVKAEDEARIMSAADFAEYSQIGAGKGEDTAKWWEFWEKPENNIAQMRNDPELMANYEQTARESDGALSPGVAKNALLDQLAYKAAKYMKDNEYAIYNYYVGKGDTEQAEAYLASLEEDLNLRQANQMVLDVKGNRLKELEFAFEAGTNQFVTGMRNVDNWLTGKAPDLTPAVQYANAEIGGSMEGGWKVAYDLTSTTANMLPSILVSMLPFPGAAIAGTATMGVSATGNAYKEMRDMGYDEGAAQNYAFLVGASEATLQYALGGISKLGGKVSGNVITNVVNKVDNALAKVAIKLGGNMLSEGVEEATQSVLEPIFQAVTTGEDFEGIDIEEVVYSGLLGMLSAGLLEGGSTVAGSAIAGSEAKQNYGKGTELVAEALEINPNNTFAQKLQAKLDKGKALSGLELNELVAQNESAMVEQDTDAIRQAAEQRLTELGEEGDVAAIATALAKQAKGEKLSVSDRYLIRNSMNGQRVANELNPENIKSGEYTSGWAEKIRTNRINAQEYGRMIAELESENVQTEPVEADVPDTNVAENAPVVAEDLTAEAETVDVAESAPVTEQAVEGEFETVESVQPEETVENINESVETVGETVGETDTVAPTAELEEASKKYGAQAGAMVHTYTPGQDVEAYDTAYRAAYDMGAAGVSRSYAMGSDALSYLSESQRQLAYETGRAASETAAQEQATKNKAAANGKTGRRKGTVKGEGVTVAELKKTFNDTQGTAYKLLSTYAEATGIDIVLYRSEAGADGNFEGAQGKFKWSEDAIYIDLNAGLSNVKSMDDVAKYTMLRTFAHEFAHFVEKWNPVQYNEFRRVVFDTMEGRGENVHALILRKQEQSGLEYEKASREVMAEAMTDILPDANFVEQLAQNHKTIFNKLLERLKEFVADLKAYFNTIGTNPSREARALKEQVGESMKYLDSIVALFDRVAVEAVENYQMTVATEEAVEENVTEQTTSDIPATQNHDTIEEKPSDFETAFWNASQAERDEVVEAINENNKLTHMMPTEIHGEKPTSTVEEVTENVENVDNQGPVLEPDADGQGASRLLDESQDADVPRAQPERETLGAPEQRGAEVARDGDRADADAGNRGSEGDGESGDLRRDGVVTEETTQDTDQDTEPLRETVEREIEQKSTEKPKGNNFVIGDSLNLPSGEKAKFRANVDAIRLIKQIETEGRYATATEQETLSKYIGWGGLDKAFGHYQYNREARKSEWVPVDGWEREFTELKSLVDEGIISEQEYKNMSESTKNAHYTSVEVIKAMYDGLKQMGFTGGRMLEPSSGVGNFVGAMPTDMSAKVQSWTMVELDRVTGLIAKYLYPNADVRVQGFETANIPDNYMDVAIGNVPFGNFGVVDRTYPKRITKSIHNYFFAKSLDKVRPGGIVMFITSSFTMDSKDNTVRQYIMERADLLGAIRLPNTAFKGNAGTEVVTDILILKKRDGGTEYGGEEFLSAEYDGDYGTYVSSYFKKHPEMLLGKPVTKRGMYGSNTMTFEPFTDRGTIDDQIREAFKGIKGTMDYPATTSRERTNFAVQRANKKTKDGGFVVGADGSISRNENGQLVKYDTDEKTAKRIAGMLSIRDAYKALASYLQQGQDAKIIKKARKELNQAYDTFVKEYGYLNTAANKRAIDSDPDSYSILSLENFDAKTKVAKKADIFTKDTISANRTITHVDSVDSGVITSINLTGGVDAALIAKLTDKTVEDVTREIIEARLAFKTRDGALIHRETYLSGNVRAKLREAEALAPLDSDFNHNVEELRRVIPADIPYNEIYITPGSTFIPNEVYADFIAHMLGGRNNPNSYSGPDVEVGRTTSGEFKIILNNKRLKSNYHNTQTWGTSRKSFLDLIDAMMGSRTVKVVDNFDAGDGKKISVVNEAETEAANEKVQAIQKEFEDWIWKDEGRREALSRLYNETFNALVNPKYDGSHISVNGINPSFNLMEHQANAVHRIIASGGNTLLAHRVGAGKTLEMAAAAMKMRELGVIKKPVFVVPKSVVAQWGVEFHQYFPAARLLVSDEKSFTPANRKVFTNKIANGDYDAVILTYEQFEKIPMSAEYQAQFYQEQIDEIINAIAEEKAESRDGRGLTVKEMEKKKAQLEKKLKELTTKPKDEDNVDFEMLGIDSLFVDEAHNFKNLEYVSKMTNVAGLGSAKGSQRAFDLYTKTRYLQGLNGGRGIVFATATPVMNSMVELYIMQRYLQPDVLNQLGLKSFDAWAKQFGEVVNKWEINPSGTGMRQKQVFANFRNLNELQLLFRSFADVVTELPYLKIPKMKDGAVKIVECEPGEFQKQYMANLQERAEKVKNVDPKEDNMLKITSDGRKVSYTQRMIDPSLPYEPGSKIFRAAENVLTEYKASADIKGTQIVFLDMATPKGTDKSKTDADSTTTDDGFDSESARLYDDMRDYLVENGIPKREIAFIHEADSDAKRKQLFEDVNNGKVRVLMGSTGKMGVGMNAQKRVVAIHHLDAPWRPGDVEQRDGRAFRQKNINDFVSKYVYVTKGSFDSRLWDILDRKQHFINQIMNGEDVGRTAEDTGEVTLSAAEVKALASGNPLIEEQTKLTDAIKKLENLQKAYNSSIVLARTKLSDDQKTIALHQNRIAHIREDISTRVDTYSEGKFSMTVGKSTFTDKKDAGAALLAEIMAKAGQDAYVTVGKFAGFELRAIKEGTEYKGLIHGKETYKFNVYMTTTTMVNRIGDIIAGFENLIQNSEQTIAETTADLEAQKNILEQPFERADELAQKRERFNEVMELLSPKTEQQFAAEDEQEQSREYLDGEQEQQRTDTLTDREVLAMAADRLESSNLTEGERDALKIFKDRLNNLQILQEQRQEQGRLYKEQQFGAKVDRKAAAETLNRMHVLDEKIKEANAAVLAVEDKQVLGGVLQKARKVVEEQERKHGKEILDRWRDRTKNAAAIKKYRERIKADVDALSGWILKPDNKDIVKHVPDALKNTVIPFLTSIDFTSKQQLRGGEATKADAAFMERLNKLNEALKGNLDVNGLYSGYNDLPPGFMENMQTFINSMQAIVNQNSGEFIINRMTAEELESLSKVVRTLKKYITQINKFHANAMFQHVYEAGDNTIESLARMESNNGRSNGVSNFVFWQQMRPAYAFERFGEGGKAIYDGLRRGQAQLAFNTQKIVEFSEEAYTAEEVKAWEKEVKEIQLGGHIVKMKVSHMMSFYELSKQADSLRHILKGGIRVATYTQKGKKISDNGHIVTEADVQTIIGALTERQKEVADNLQHFMAQQGGEWGNYVSVARFGEELFGNPEYFPINSDGRHLQSMADENPEGASLYALLNMSFTKSRNEKANNRIVLYSIFDVFSNHMASMAQYNAMALPVLDALKWFNYQQKAETSDGERYIVGSVREQMDRVYGVPEESRPGKGASGYAQNFVANILKAFNGTEAQGIPSDSFGMNATRRYNMAQVAYNLRVVVQQPLSMTRAALLIDYGSIMKGLKLNPKAIQKNIEEMQKNSGIAVWKSLGFYDVNISRGLTDLIKHKSNAMDKIQDVGMWGAGKADIITWAAIWSAAKEEVTKKQGLKPGQDGFYEAVTTLFEDIIYKTQVVDSILTKNEYMRSKGFFARAMGSFMSEPTTTASMVLSAYDQYHRDMLEGDDRREAWRKNSKMIGRTLYVYGVTQALLAAVTAVMDAFRDDDDYETFLEKWLEAFGGNLVDELMPFNKLPLVSEIYEVIKELLAVGGWDTYGQVKNFAFADIFADLIKGWEIIHDKITGEDTNYEWYGGIYKLLQAVSGMSGLPMAAATRELVTIWNQTVGAMAPSLKVKTYDSGEMNEIKYAYADGYLTPEEATSLLMEKGLVDNEDEAYFTIQGWEVGTGYSRYDKIYDAVLNGGDFDGAMAELNAHGIDEKTVRSQIQTKIGQWYYDEQSQVRITKQQAISMLEKYTDKTSEEITKLVNKWSSRVVTGIAYDDIDDAFMDGDITAARAAEMYRLYGGMTREEAEQDVTVLQFAKEWSIEPGEISYSFVDGFRAYCEPEGVDVKVFLDVWKFKGKAATDRDEDGEIISSTKEKVLEYVDSLNLTRKQKNSVYLALGYAESTIRDAPWR